MGKFLDENIPIGEQLRILKLIVVWETRCWSRSWSNDENFIIAQFEHMGLTTVWVNPQLTPKGKEYMANIGRLQALEEAGHDAEGVDISGDGSGGKLSHVQVSVERLAELEKVERRMRKLEAAGVDNWEGYPPLNEDEI